MHQQNPDLPRPCEWHIWSSLLLQSLYELESMAFKGQLSTSTEIRLYAHRHPFIFTSVTSLRYSSAPTYALSSDGFESYFTYAKHACHTRQTCQKKHHLTTFKTFKNRRIIRKNVLKAKLTLVTSMVRVRVTQRTCCRLSCTQFPAKFGVSNLLWKGARLHFSFRKQGLNVYLVGVLADASIQSCKRCNPSAGFLPSRRGALPMVWRCPCSQPTSQLLVHVDKPQDHMWTVKWWEKNRKHRQLGSCGTEEWDSVKEQLCIPAELWAPLAAC